MVQSLSTASTTARQILATSHRLIKESININPYKYMFAAIILTLVIWALIFYVLFWGLARLAPIAPFYKIIETILVVAVIIVLIGVLTGKITPFPFLNGLVR